MPTTRAATTTTGRETNGSHMQKNYPHTHRQTQRHTQRQRNIRIKLWTPSPSRTACTDNEAAWRGQIKSTRRWECNNKRAECAHWSLHPCLVIVCARSLSHSLSCASSAAATTRQEKTFSANRFDMFAMRERASERGRTRHRHREGEAERESERVGTVCRVSAQFPLRTLGAAALLLSIIQTVNVVE